MRELEKLGEEIRQSESYLTAENAKRLRIAFGHASDACTLLETKYQRAIRDRAAVHSLLKKTSEDLIQRYQTIFEYSGTAMVVLEQDGTISLANSYVMSLLGYPRDEIEGHKKFSEFVDAKLDNHVREYLLHKGGSDPDLPQNFEGQVTARDGRRLDVSVRIGRFPRTGQCLLSIIDISDRRHAEEALGQAIKKLNLLNSVTRHDVINKLTMLTGFIQLANQKADSPPAVRSFLSKSLSSATAIRELIEFTKYYQDIGVKQPEWYDVAKEIRQAATQVSHGDLAITVELGGLQVYADPLIRKVFYNLMDNAIRHGEHVTSLSFTLREEGSGFVILCTDNGIGIPDDLKERIFTRGFGKNTGLGLFLSREILSITGITIRETGVFGTGCRFEILIPQNVGRIRKTPSP